GVLARELVPVTVVLDPHGAHHAAEPRGEYDHAERRRGSGSPQRNDRRDEQRPHRLRLASVPMSWAVPNTCPCIAASTSRFVAPACNFSGASSAYSLKKYRCAGPGGGHGPPYPGRRKSVRPWSAPPRSGSVSVLGTF